MLNLLALDFGTVMSNFWNRLVDSLSLAENIWAIVLAIVGITVSVLAKRITRMIRKNNTVSNNDNVLIFIKAIGLGLIFVALMLVVLPNFV